MESGQAETATKLRLRPLLWSLAAIPVFVLLITYPIVRFASDGLNKTVGILLFLALPLCVVVSLFLVGRRWSAVAGFVLTLALVFVMPLLLLPLLFVAGQEKETLQELEWRGSTVRVYRANAGGISGFGVHAEQRLSIFPGVVSIRRIFSWSHCGSVTVKTTDRGIQVTGDARGCSAQLVGLEFPLKRFLYF